MSAKLSVVFIVVAAASGVFLADHVSGTNMAPAVKTKQQTTKASPFVSQHHGRAIGREIDRAGNKGSIREDERVDVPKLITAMYDGSRSERVSAAATIHDLYTQ